MIDEMNMPLPTDEDLEAMDQAIEASGDKIFEVEIFSFGGKGKIRPVKVKNGLLSGKTENDLELIFKYGQNDFQTVSDCHSVSVGDIANVDGEKYLVLGLGWHKMDAITYAVYKKACQLGNDLTHQKLVWAVETALMEKKGK
jgi:hypothetical protein